MFGAVEENPKILESCPVCAVSSTPPTDDDSIIRAVPKMLSDVKDYVAEMGVASRVYELIVGTEPSDMRRFVGTTIDTLVPDVDPIEDELQTAADARNHGLTTGEMRRRAAQAQACWDMPLQLTGQAELTTRWNCAEAIKWGVNVSTYSTRFTAVKEACAVPFDVDDESAWSRCIRSFLMAK